MMRQAEKYRNIAANYDHMALAINDQELRWMYLDFAQHGAKWRSKPKLKMIWIVRSSADGGAAPSRRSAGRPALVCLSSHSKRTVPDYHNVC